MASAGSGMSENLPSEGVYEDIGAVTMGEKDVGPSMSRDLVLPEDYDDVWEPERGPEEQEEEQEQEEGAALSPEGVHLCAVVSAVSAVLVLLYCAHVQAAALATTYI